MARKKKTRQGGSKSAQPAKPAPGAQSSAESSTGEVQQLHKTLCPVVGLGASAGGLEAFTEFFQAMAANSGMAFVVLSHLDPAHKSALGDILAKISSMPVKEVEANTPIEPNHVYVLPPNKGMIIDKGVLHLVTRPESLKPHLPVDGFLRSLARECGVRAIGVILSGTGSDGTLGLKAIKEEGGITFAQDESAKHAGMPHSATAAGCVDYIVAPAQIARELVRIARQLDRAEAQTSEVSKTSEVSHDRDGFLQVLRLLSSATGVDFIHYKHSTLRRRIERRMVLRRVQNMSDYQQILRADRSELQALYEEVLIPVTGFFRDPDTFEAIKDTIFPRLLEDRPADLPLRIWVPGCSTGEEAYSLAMCLLECLGTTMIPIKIFATNISERAIDVARTGIYGEGIAADVSAQRLHRFFQKIDRGYQINKMVRDLCVFARQDVTKDPPFSQLDLISCRNVLIYLEPILQNRVLPIFHYALKPGGILVLGNAETIVGFADFFEAIDKKHKFYVRSVGVSRMVFDHVPGAHAPVVGLAHDGASEAGRSLQDVYREADRVVLARYAPPGVIVDDRLQVVQFRGRTGPCLEAAPGAPSLDILQMAREGMLAELRSALEQARQSNMPVQKDKVHVKNNDHFQDIDLDVIPITDPASGTRYLVVLFAMSQHRQTSEVTKTSEVSPGGPKPRPSRAAQAEMETEKGREASRLKDELDATRSYLRSVIEAKEAGNEELRAANEEIVSANEELQSTNEELETAKEELQAANEELRTLNDELQNRIRVTNELGDDLANLIDSANIPIVVLAPDLRIRRFTPSAERVLNLRSTDVGRPIGDLKLKINVPDLEQLAGEVMYSREIKQREVSDQQGNWHKLSVRPYQTMDHRIAGVVLTLIDIDVLKRRERQVEEAGVQAQRLAALVESSDDAICGKNLDGTITSWNHGAERLYGYSASEAVGRCITMLAPPDCAAEQEQIMERVRGGEDVKHIETRRLRKDGREVLISLTVSPIKDGAGKVVGSVAIARDVTQRKALEREVLEIAALEQRRIGQELHDTTGQDLTALGLLAESLVEPLKKRCPEDAKIAGKLAQGLRRALGQVRALSRGLIPVEIDAHGLMAALADLATTIKEQAGIDCTFQCANPVLVENNATATNLYRIAKEATANALKHARASRIEISLAADDGALILQVKDNGIGLPKEKGPDSVGRLVNPSHEGVGMKIMHYRAGLINAQLHIDRVEPNGTVVKCILPGGGMKLVC